jgi:hypothetical protein
VVDGVKGAVPLDVLAGNAGLVDERGTDGGDDGFVEGFDDRVVDACLGDGAVVELADDSGTGFLGRRRPGRCRRSGWWRPGTGSPGARSELAILQRLAKRLGDVATGRSRGRWNLPEGWVISKRPAHAALASEADFVAAQDAGAPRPGRAGGTPLPAGRPAGVRAVRAPAGISLVQPASPPTGAGTATPAPPARTPPGRRTRTCGRTRSCRTWPPGWPRRAGLAAGELREVYYTALLRSVGCTSDAHEQAVLLARAVSRDPIPPGQLNLPRPSCGSAEDGVFASCGGHRPLLTLAS